MGFLKKKYDGCTLRMTVLSFKKKMTTIPECSVLVGSHSEMPDSRSSYWIDDSDNDKFSLQESYD